ncbi:3-methyladenine DNA glycosylase [Aliifodinibius salipaludis]|uniref:Putative 3-methyladenine DNA glycosylase n=1 Tax=Fodinibius salipaludis TaxID=2032627 RepID=A0A2A2GA15_9BACT|nr:DNA-3-methyladenine glycosylase [Aliifodinibius salipaludis]PAU94158.1 3-methyladenine DNA glycosylase [Aliifodinibius salipaludis]
MSNRKLPLSFYRRQDVVSIAQELVGKVLCTRIGSASLTSGIITETEAYCGRGDQACHANNGTRTDRTETMYQAGGIAYIYLCYGIHHLFNVVTNAKNKADAVLIRAIQPLDGKKEMLQRRNKENINPALTAGPGRLTQALGITTGFDGTPLIANSIWIEDRQIDFGSSLVANKRVGVDYAGKDAKLPWRFYPQESKWVSQK